MKNLSPKEAIALLRNLEDSLDSYCELNEEGKTAFRMAIEALSCSEIPNNWIPCSEKLPSVQPKQNEMIKEIRKWINSGNRGNADYFIVDRIEEIINAYEIN